MERVARKFGETFGLASLASCFVSGFHTFERQNLDSADAGERAFKKGKFNNLQKYH